MIESAKVLEIGPQQFPDIAVDILAFYRTAVLRQNPICVREDRRDGPPRVAPLVNHLFEHARIGVLRNEGGALHLQPLSRDLLDNRRIVEEPPASEGHEVREFARVDTQLVLILAAQHRDKKTIRRKFAAQILQTLEV